MKLDFQLIYQHRCDFNIAAITVTFFYIEYDAHSFSNLSASAN